MKLISIQSQIKYLKTSIYILSHFRNILFIYLVYLRKSSRRGAGDRKVFSVSFTVCYAGCLHGPLPSITHMHEFAGQYLKLKYVATLIGGMCYMIIYQ